MCKTLREMEIALSIFDNARYLLIAPIFHFIRLCSHLRQNKYKIASKTKSHLFYLPVMFAKRLDR